ncbi:helix-turn-helix transcriptional regulator [Kibdelosporangium aridum]|uniref:helix-turn-helix transcriptional regulator n=1 Tax=Kibdelosporangium aridum TaxID=2030 RepID=UPI00052752B7
MQPLQALGISADAERVYLDLVEHGTTGIEPEHKAVAELEAAGLVERSGDTLVACPPQLAMEALAERYTALARQSAAMLARVWNKTNDTYLEVLPSYSAGRAVLDRVQTDARTRVRALSVGNLGPDGHKIVEGLFDALARGVAYQVIYGTHVLRDPEALRMVQRCVDAGEQARVFPHVSMNLTIVDDRWALLTARSDEDIAAVVVHRSPLLTGFVGIFDAYWRMAVPITAGTETAPAGDTPSRDTQRLLTYLSAGLTDEAIAREFGVSERTVARRISRLQEILGAQTRFQLGVQASRHGWL